MAVEARRVTVRGRVQGVFFRDSTRQHAQQAGVAGWVRNTSDGTVEVWLEGDPDALDDVEEWIRGGGPNRASVNDVGVEQVDPEGHDDFAVRS